MRPIICRICFLECVRAFCFEGLRLGVDGQFQLTFNNSYMMVDAVLNGFGIAYVSKDIVRRHIDAGRLTLVLDD